MTSSTTSSGALEHPATTGIVEIGGPDVLSYGDMMRTYARLRGLRRLMIPVPVLTPRLSSYWVNLISPVPASDRPAADRGSAQRGGRPRSGAGPGIRPLAACPTSKPSGGAMDRARTGRPGVDVVRRLRRPRPGEPLVPHVHRGDDRRAPPAGRPRPTRRGVRRDRARRRRRRLAVRERAVARSGPDRSRRGWRRDAAPPSGPRHPPGRATLWTSGASRRPTGRPCCACGPR